MVIAWVPCYGKNRGQRLGRLDIMTSGRIYTDMHDYGQDGVVIPHIRRSSRNSDGGSALATSR